MRLLLTHGDERRQHGGPSRRIALQLKLARERGVRLAHVHWTDGVELPSASVIHVFNSWPMASAEAALRAAKAVSRAVVYSPILLDLSLSKAFGRDVPALLRASGKHEFISAGLRALRGCGPIDSDLRREGIPGHYEHLRRTLALADCTVFLSDVERRFAHRIGAWSRFERLVRNPWPARVKTRGGSAPHIANYVLTVGRIEPRKNQALLALSMQHLPHPLVTVGAIADFAYFELLREISRDQLVYVPHLDRAQLEHWYDHALAFALPSWAEGASMAALEADLFGLPMVLSNLSSEREYFPSAQHVHPADLVGMQAALSNAVGQPRRAESDGSEELYYEELSAVYRDVEAQTLSRPKRDLASARKKRTPTTQPFPKPFKNMFHSARVIALGATVPNRGPDYAFASPSMRLRLKTSPVYGAARDARDHLRSFSSRHLSRRRNPSRGDVLVAGLLTSSSGLGAAARLSIDSLSKLCDPLATLDLTGLCTDHSRTEDDFGSSIISDAGACVLQVNPPELIRALPAIGRRYLAKRQVFGYWAWELPNAPSSWLRAAPLVDEIWAPSTYVANAFNKVSKPVRVVPHPVATPTPSVASRSDLGLPTDAFIFVTAFDALSSFARKNPAATVRAFREAFGTRADVHLVVKTQNAARVPKETRELLSVMNNAKNIQLWDQALPHADVLALIANADAFVSLHRAEGFGLALAEAMLLGTPVAATAWSGNVDFMNRVNSLPIAADLVPVRDSQQLYQGQQWAEPREEDAVKALRLLAERPVLIRDLVEEAKALDLPGAFARACAPALRPYVSMLPAQ